VGRSMPFSQSEGVKFPQIRKKEPRGKKGGIFTFKSIKDHRKNSNRAGERKKRSLTENIQTETSLDVGKEEGP